MLKSDILKKLELRHKNLSEGDIEQIFNIFIKKIISALKNDKNVELRGFGTLKKKINKKIVNGYRSDVNKFLKISEIEEIIKDPTSKFNIPLQDYDELYILSQRDFMDEFPIEINGEVRFPGSFPYGEGVKLGDLIFLSGGMTQQSAGGKIEISRAVDYDDSNNQILPKRIILAVWNFCLVFLDL